MALSESEPMTTSATRIEEVEVNQGEAVCKGAPNSGPQFSLYQPVLKPVRETPVPRLDTARLDWRGGLVVRATNWMGDTLITLPAVYKLRAFLPKGCGLFVLCSHQLAPLWHQLPWVDRVISFRGPRVVGPAADAVKELKPGVGLVLPNSFGAAFDLFNAGIPVRVGRSGRWRRMMLTHTLPPLWHTMHPGLCHQLSEHLELISMFGDVTWDADYPPMEVPDTQEVLEKFGLADDQPLLVLAPGAAYGVAKQWSPAGYRAVAQWWVGRGGRVIVLGSKREARVGDEVVAGLADCQNLAGRTTIRELLPLLKRGQAAAANDSGLMHLASALGVPGVGIFGCTDPVATGPLRGRWVILMEKLGCAPCFKRKCQLTNADCLGLRQIPATLVCEALEFVLKGPGTPG